MTGTPATGSSETREPWYAMTPSLPCTAHHPLPDWKGSRTHWEGDYEITTDRFACPSCLNRGEVVTYEHVGPPTSADLTGGL